MLFRSVPFARLQSPQSAWPGQLGRQLGYRFRGYRLDSQRRPAFRYTFHDLKIEDHLKPVGGTHQAHFERRLTIRQPDKAGDQDDPGQGLWHLAAAGSKIERRKDGSFLIDGRLQLRIQAGKSVQPMVRKSGNRSELLVPVQFGGRPAVIVVSYIW